MFKCWLINIVLILKLQKKSAGIGIKDLFFAHKREKIQEESHMKNFSPSPFSIKHLLDIVAIILQP